MKLVPAAIGSPVGLTQPLRDNFKLQSTVIHLLIRISILLVKLHIAMDLSSVVADADIFLIKFIQEDASHPIG